jgi:hypothetical protein
LKRTVLPALTLIDSPVRGLSALRAFVLRTVKVPKLGRVNFPDFFISLTMASINSLVARLAAAPVTSVDCWRTFEINAFDIYVPCDFEIKRRVDLI